MATNGRRSFSPYEQTREQTRTSYVDVSAPAVKNFIDTLHTAFVDMKPAKALENVYFQNCILALASVNSEIGPRDYVVQLNRKYQIETEGAKVISALRGVRMNTPNERTQLIQWASTAVDLFISALSGRIAQYDEFVGYYDVLPVAEACQVKERLFIIAMYSRHEELDIYNDITLLLRAGTDDVCKRYFFKAMEILSRAHGFPTYVPKVACVGERRGERGIDRNNNRQSIERTITREIKPIDIEQPSVKQIIDETHISFMEWKDNDCKNEVLLENRLFDVICGVENGGPISYARIYTQRFGGYVDGSTVLDRLRARHIANQSERNQLFAWAVRVEKHFSKAILGYRDQYDSLVQLLREGHIPNQPRIYSLERVAVIMIYHNHPELDVYHDMESLFKIGNNVLARNYLNNLLDALCKVHNFPVYSLKAKGNATKIQGTVTPKISLEQALSQIDQLEIKLQRTNAMLKDLQDEFQQQLDESKVTALTDFFASLNSDRYGNILDMVLQLRKGITRLSKSSYELPEDLNGLFVMYNKLVQFIRDSHIDPIRRPGFQAEVTASEIEFCDYEGSPFESEDEVKLVETVSPGWIYKDQNVQISRPKVKEVISESSFAAQEISCSIDQPTTAEGNSAQLGEQVDFAASVSDVQGTDITEVGLPVSTGESVLETDNENEQEIQGVSIDKTSENEASSTTADSLESPTTYEFSDSINPSDTVSNNISDVSSREGKDTISE